MLLKKYVLLSLLNTVVLFNNFEEKSSNLIFQDTFMNKKYYNSWKES